VLPGVYRQAPRPATAPVEGPAAWRVVAREPRWCAVAPGHVVHLGKAVIEAVNWMSTRNEQGCQALNQSGVGIALELVVAFATRSLVGRILVDHHVDRGRPMAGQGFGASEAEPGGSPRLARPGSSLASLWTCLMTASRSSSSGSPNLGYVMVLSFSST
jgi:hypothetical protein